MIPLIIQGQSYTIQNLQRSPIPQNSNWSGTFFCYFLQQTGSRTKIDTSVIVILPLSISMVLRKEEDGKCVEEGGGALCGGGMAVSLFRLVLISKRLSAAADW